ncbi:MAG: hypothetical protein LQ350_002283 [Teloschistes chrysophthalmus]|nr:MAG: hypothetical protein LQ350_002283 [Niorma chrysophthalma]
MYVTALIVALTGLFCQALAAPNAVEEQTLQNTCDQDNLLRSFIDPRYSASASSFCSTYIQPTVTATTTATTTAASAKVKRDFATGTFAPSRLSSACSCILTATPFPKTVATITTTVIEPTTIPSTCSIATPIVENGGFESGSLAPWSLTKVSPPLPDNAPYLTVGVTKQGYGGSQYAFTATDKAASSHVEIDIAQTLTLCPGDYKFAAKFYMTDAHDGPQTFVQAFINDKAIATGTAADASGPDIFWKPLTGIFTATSNTVTLKVVFSATDYLGVQWAVDDVVIALA